MAKPKQGVPAIDDRSIEVNPYINYYIVAVDNHVGGPADYRLVAEPLPVPLVYSVPHVKPTDTIESLEKTSGQWYYPKFSSSIRTSKNGLNGCHRTIQKSNTLDGLQKIVKFKPTIESRTREIDHLFVFGQESTFLFLQLKKTNDQKIKYHPVIG